MAPGVPAGRNFSGRLKTHGALGSEREGEIGNCGERRELSAYANRRGTLGEVLAAGADYFEAKNRSRTSVYQCAATSTVLPAIESLISSMGYS